MVKIRANGESREVASGTTLENFVLSIGLTPLRCLAELNGQVIPQTCYADTLLKDGDVLEILQIVAGG